MPVKTDARGAYRAGTRFKDMATRMAKAEQLAASDLQRRLVPEFVRGAQVTHNIAPARVRASSAVMRRGNAVQLTGYDRPTGLMQFGAKASAAGVTVTVAKATGPVRLRHAFIASGVSSNRQVFQRVAYGKGAFKRVMTKGNYKGQRRTPIDVKYGPSVAQILRNQQLKERLIQFAQQTSSAEVRRQLGRL